MKKLLLCLALVLAPAAAHAQNFPDRKGLAVVDEANIIPDDKERVLNNRIVAWNKSAGRQLVVVTPASLQGADIKDYGYKLGRFWKLGNGQMASQSTGVVLIYAPKEKRARIEVGRGLEYVLTDAASKGIIKDIVIARAKVGDPVGAIEGAVDAIIAIATPESPAPAAAAQPAVSRPAAPQDSGGGGWILFLLGFVGIAAGFVFFIRSKMKKEELARLESIREINRQASEPWPEPTKRDAPKYDPNIMERVFEEKPKRQEQDYDPAAAEHILQEKIARRQERPVERTYTAPAPRVPKPRPAPPVQRYSPPPPPPVKPYTPPRVEKKRDEDDSDLGGFIAGAAIGSMFGSSSNNNEDDSNKSSWSSPSSDTFSSGGSDTGFGGGGADDGW